MTTTLVPLDGSALAEYALAYAVPLARATRGLLLLVRACPTDSPVFLDSGAVVHGAMAAHAADVREATAAMEKLAETLRADDLVVDAVVRSGAAPEVILEQVGASGADLIAMSTHGRGGMGRFVYGSVADEVLRHAEVPVLLVPGRSRAAWPDHRPRRVLVALDGSDLAEASLGPAVALARMFGATLVLLRVVDPPEGLGKYAHVRAERARARRYLAALAKDLGIPRSDVAVEVRVGPAGPTIAAAAEELGADAIAMGTHGRSGLSRLVMGSVATATLLSATVPLLLVSAAAARRGTQPASAGGDHSPPGRRASERHRGRQAVQLGEQVVREERDSNPPALELVP